MNFFRNVFAAIGFLVSIGSFILCVESNKDSDNFYETSESFFNLAIIKIKSVEKNVNILVADFQKVVIKSSENTKAVYDLNQTTNLLISNGHGILSIEYHRSPFNTYEEPISKTLAKRAVKKMSRKVIIPSLLDTLPIHKIRTELDNRILLLPTLT